MKFFPLLGKKMVHKAFRRLCLLPVQGLSVFCDDGRAARQRKAQLKAIFPFFILYFIAACLITTLAVHLGVAASFFAPLKTLSKFLIVVAMAAIGLNTNIVKLIRTGGKPLLLGLCCWAGITGTSLLAQHLLGIW